MFNYVIVRVFVCKNKNLLYGYVLLGVFCYSCGKNMLYLECWEI